MYNKFSRVVTKDDSQPAAQAMLHAIGLSEEDFDKPFIGIGSTGYEGNPCNMHLNDLPDFGELKSNRNSPCLLLIKIMQALSALKFKLAKCHSKYKTKILKYPAAN